MSTHRVEICQVDEVNPHPNADRLDLIKVKGWHCVSQKHAFKQGDRCLYIPIDSVLPQQLEERLFPKDSKIVLSKHRVKTIKIRGAISQGMAIPVSDLGLESISIGTDLAKKLEITKYEPPRKLSGRSNLQQKKPSLNNSHFHKYTDIENIKNYPTVFTPGEPVVVTEKIHGTNFRAGWVPFQSRTLWHKIRGWFGKNPQYEFVYGSRNLQLSLFRNRNKTYYADNVYWEAVEKYQLREKLEKGVVVYGEIYGPDIQKGYHYGLKSGERALVLFDVYRATPIEPRYLNPDDARTYLNSKGLPVVPVLFQGPFNMESINHLVAGDSIKAPSQKVREGVVVRSIVETHDYYGRKLLKAINPDYLLSKAADEEVAHDQIGA